MCLIVFNWQPVHQHSPASLPWLVLAANRDEFHQRATAPLHYWSDHPQILAGRDLQQMGSWLGITTTGRFAAVTNIRRPGVATGTRSRGELVNDFLLGTLTPQQHAEQLLHSAADYGLFNLLIGTADSLCYVRNWPQPHMEAVQPGMHVLSNAALDSDWPKARQARNQLYHWLMRQTNKTEQHKPQQHQMEQPGQLSHLLTDSSRWPDFMLPDTGVPLAWERLLSPQKIISPEYGTRSSSSLIAHSLKGQLDAVMEEQQWHPDGTAAELRRFRISGSNTNREPST